MRDLHLVKYTKKITEANYYGEHSYLLDDIDIGAYE